MKVDLYIQGKTKNPAKQKGSGKMAYILCIKQWRYREKRWSCHSERCDNKESCPLCAQSGFAKIQ